MQIVNHSLEKEEKSMIDIKELYKIYGYEVVDLGNGVTYVQKQETT